MANTSMHGLIIALNSVLRNVYMYVTLSPDFHHVPKEHVFDGLGV